MRTIANALRIAPNSYPILNSMGSAKSFCDTSVFIAN